MRARARPSRHRGRGHWRAAADIRALQAYRPRSPAARPVNLDRHFWIFTARTRASISSDLCNSPITKSRASLSVPDVELAHDRLISPPSMAPSALPALIIARGRAARCSAAPLPHPDCGIQRRNRSTLHVGFSRMACAVAACSSRRKRRGCPSSAIDHPPPLAQCAVAATRTAPARAAAHPSPAGSPAACPGQEYVGATDVSSARCTQVGEPPWPKQTAASPPLRAPRPSQPPADPQRDRNPSPRGPIACGATSRTGSFPPA